MDAITDDISVTAPIAAAPMGKRMEHAGHNPVLPAVLEPAAEAALADLTAEALVTPRPRAAPSSARVTAVLLTRDRPELLLRALASIERSQAPAKTLVIDNGSSTEGAQALAAICEGRTSAVLKRSERNLGCAGGRRLGVELADTEFVLFLDDDAELMPGALDHLVAELDRNPRVGAVTATVVGPEGRVMHSGGSMEVEEEIVTFTLLGWDVPFVEADLPPSGASGWVPGGASLTRLALLREFPIDVTMGSYYEDNEWCYRVERARPDSFRRSREALVLHHVQPRCPSGSDLASRSHIVQLLGSHARFYELHGVLLGPWLFSLLIPELRTEDGRCDLAAARVLMELVASKGTDWTLRSWMNGDLNGLLEANRRLVKLRAVETELGLTKAALEREAAEARARAAQVADLTAQVAELRAEVSGIAPRPQPVEQSVTWQILQRMRGRAFKLLGGEQFGGVRVLHRALRLFGRTLQRHRS